MAQSEDVSSIADASKPNAGRIYDYLLGGNHNFEIDRQSADQLLKMMPEITQWVRAVRWFLGEAVRRLSEEGFRHFLDFASGLPTVDHIHHIAAEGARVIYSDIDPVTVAYAKEIVAELPGTACVECDVSAPERLLESGIVEEIFGDTRKAAIGVSGICWFLQDEAIAHALEVLYKWADPGSKLYICDINRTEENATAGNVADFYRRVGQPLYYRSVERLTELLGKWRVCDPGFMPIEDYLNVDDSAIKRTASEAKGNVLGAILVK